MNTYTTDRLGVTIHVTKEHIAKGDKHDCRKCPVALAVKDAFPFAEIIDADLEKIRIDSRWFETPDKVARFMNRFDYGSRWTMRPIKFQLQREYVGQYSWETIEKS